MIVFVVPTKFSLTVLTWNSAQSHKTIEVFHKQHVFVSQNQFFFSQLGIESSSGLSSAFKVFDIFRLSSLSVFSCFSFISLLFLCLSLSGRGTSTPYIHKCSIKDFSSSTYHERRALQISEGWKRGTQRFFSANFFLSPPFLLRHLQDEFGRERLFCCCYFLLRKWKNTHYAHITNRWTHYAQSMQKQITHTHAHIHTKQMEKYFELFMRNKLISLHTRAHTPACCHFGFCASTHLLTGGIQE